MSIVIEVDQIAEVKTKFYGSRDGLPVVVIMRLATTLEQERKIINEICAKNGNDWVRAIVEAG